MQGLNDAIQQRLAEGKDIGLYPCTKPVIKGNMHEYKVIAQIQAENNKLKAQLARLDDVEGLAQFMLFTTGSTSKLEDLFIFEQDLYIKKAQAVINYIKGE